MPGEALVDFQTERPRLSQVSHLTSKPGEHFGSLCLRGRLESLLNDIVTVLILKQRSERLGLHDLRDDQVSHLEGRAIEALLDNVGRVLLPAQSENLAKQLLANDDADAWDFELKHVLEQVVGVWVLDKCLSVLGDLVRQVLSLA